jgi:hypothetical protein
MTLTHLVARHGVVQMVPTLALCSMEMIFGAGAPGQTFFSQLYGNRDCAVTRKLVQKAERCRAKVLFITVDALQLGRHKKDMRQKFEADRLAAQEDVGAAQDCSRGAARAISVCCVLMLSAGTRRPDELHRVTQQRRARARGGSRAPERGRGCILCQANHHGAMYVPAQPDVGVRANRAPVIEAPTT